MWDFAAVSAAEISLSTLLFASFLLSLLFSSLGLCLSGSLCCMSWLAWRGFCRGESAAGDLRMLHAVLQRGVTLWKMKYDRIKMLLFFSIYMEGMWKKVKRFCVCVCL